MNKYSYKMVIFLPRTHELDPMPHQTHFIGDNLTERGALQLAEIIVSEKYPTYKAYRIEVLNHE